MVVFSLALIINCASRDKLDEGRQNADLLLEQIANGTAIGKFPKETFPPDEIGEILRGLKYKCDFANREGGFFKEAYTKRFGRPDLAYYVYKFNTACDSMRIIVSYQLKDSIELYRFDIEDVNKKSDILPN